MEASSRYHANFPPLSRKRCSQETGRTLAIVITDERKVERTGDKRKGGQDGTLTVQPSVSHIRAVTSMEFAPSVVSIIPN